jgi:hypothetical protein
MAAAGIASKFLARQTGEQAVPSRTDQPGQRSSRHKRTDAFVRFYAQGVGHDSCSCWEKQPTRFLAPVEGGMGFWSHRGTALEPALNLAQATAGDFHRPLVFPYIYLSDSHPLNLLPCLCIIQQLCASSLAPVRPNPSQ